MEGYVEDEARDQGCTKYAIYGSDEMLIVKNAVNNPGDANEAGTS